MIFEDRKEAGNLLSSKITLKDQKAFVFGIPRGGVVVAYEVSRRLKIPLDLLVCRKIGAPNNPELAIGAVGPEKTLHLDQKLIKNIKINRDQILELRGQAENERMEREKRLRGKKSYKIKDKTIILVDDGVATGATVMMAAKFLRKKEARKIILAVPVIADDTLMSLKKIFDEIIYLDHPKEFYAVGQFYRNFPQVDDKEVIKILNCK